VRGQERVGARCRDDVSLLLVEVYRLLETRGRFVRTARELEYLGEVEQGISVRVEEVALLRKSDRRRRKRVRCVEVSFSCKRPRPDRPPRHVGEDVVCARCLLARSGEMFGLRIPALFVERPCQQYRCGRVIRLLPDLLEGSASCPKLIFSGAGVAGELQNG
jgi:hypothetical protein